MVVVPAYAKLNLALEVLERRADGWHEVRSVIAVIDWHDLVGVTVAPGSPGPVTLRVTGPHAAGVPEGEGNLAVTAARAWEARSTPRRVLLWLDKHIPSEAGLGGGSADAAAVLRVLASAGGAVPPAAVRELGATLGSDVPAALAGGTVLVEGRGEHIAPLPPAPLHVAVAVAGRSSTAASYAALDPSEHTGGGRVDRVANAVRAGRLPDDADLGTALEAAACRATPDLRSRLAALRKVTSDTDRWHLTGSGGAAFAVASSLAEAQVLASSARAAGFCARACRTVGRSLLTPAYNPGS